ncbi:helix-turn-helix domain-containing protein [Paenibacillus sp. KN14-4R]|uniref:helix-turn-helix domain-containing protein n=1 Tax=Paenibacillus sp. KN14-4R TaxID=3445773 RepID=UPI003F9F659E
MYPEMHHEQVVYQNPFLAIRIWQQDSEYFASEEIRMRREQEWKQKKFYDWHYHKEVEFLYIQEGELILFYKEEQRVLRKGDIAVIGSSEPHFTLQTKEGNTSQIVFQIDLHKYWDLNTLNNMQHFSEVIRPLSSLNYVYEDNMNARMQTAALICEIYQEMNDAQIGYELAISYRIKNILLLLLRNDTKQQLNYNDNRLIGRLQPAIDYVEENLSEKLSITEISHMLNMSYTHFIKSFKKAIGMTFTDFVVFKRVKKAEQLLLTSDRSISEIAETVGISNLGHFYGMFRRLNHRSPKQFRDYHKHE